MKHMGNAVLQRATKSVSFLRPHLITLEDQLSRVLIDSEIKRVLGMIILELGPFLCSESLSFSL
jgi:hypothetical protein